jgi:uncharacterized protein (TIGR00730 family)
LANTTIQSICIYCGSADGLAPVYLEAAAETGRTLAQSGIRLVYGAGKTGMMGALADGALSAGGEAIGVVPRSLYTPALIHAHLTRLEVTDTIHERKALMSELADAFIALPGGYGTMDELFETLTWVQIGIHRKPIGLLNTRDYYNPFLCLVEHAAQEGFIFPEHTRLFVQATRPFDLINLLVNFHHPPHLERWVDR